MTRSWLIAFLVAFSLAGCAALEQFPDVSDDYSTDLVNLDPSYDAALKAINLPGASADEQKRIRNEEIDRRLRVIDANFTKFETKLAQQNVTADFGVALVEVGVGAAGSLVAETASQIFSAVSGGLAGAQAAYGEAALYEKALSALLAQMIASRKTVLVRILDGRTRGIDEYPLSVAVHDLDAYYFAGSLPGAIVGTSADAKVKVTKAEKEIDKVLTIRRDASFLAEDAVQRVNQIVAAIQGLSDSDAIALSTNPPTRDTHSEQVVSMQDPNGRRFTDGDPARTTLIRRAETDARTVGNLTKWEKALGL